LGSKGISRWCAVNVDKNVDKNFNNFSFIFQTFPEYRMTVLLIPAKRLLCLLAQALCVVVVLSSCATISGRKEYTVSLKSMPEQATVNITDERGKTVFTGQTPTYANLPTSAGGYFQGKHYTATFTKDGFMPSSAYLQHEVSGLYVVGNALFGGVLGWLVADPISGGMWRLPTDVNVPLGTQQRTDTVITPQPTTSWGRFSLRTNIAFAGENVNSQVGAISDLMLYFEVAPRFAVGFGLESRTFQNFYSFTSSFPGTSPTAQRIPVVNLTTYLAGSFLYRFQDSPLASPYLSVTGGLGLGILTLPSSSWMGSGSVGYQWMISNFSVFVEGGYSYSQGQYLFNPTTFPTNPDTFRSSFLQARAGVNFFF
jgi:hypothetical protein